VASNAPPAMKNARLCVGMIAAMAARYLTAKSQQDSLQVQSQADGEPDSASWFVPPMHRMHLVDACC
jgi:hypothetical protein